ncbi:hypothetical protein [Marinifilum flexuosum]|uniref:HU family DNA-binding protein n=1 Tax=Marinifilum flexuosum TaxID=1117708 RepID=UPI003CD0CDF2
MPGVGTIFPSISGEQSNTSTEVKADKIKEVNIKFSPAKRLKQAIKHVAFRKAKIKRASHNSLLLQLI